ncbi:MAG: HisA/HisF-related TIM barrel protein [Gammaproteobacteria bacterium]|nr:HisA/HisF-related TIM barrel protein [Gammaproteobacteria bacterium]MDH3447475.1 HisA/HisF-related TIM barrel protein [Gammaproteobacteria bacterium]
MLIIPEIQLQDGKVVTRAAIEGDDIVHDISARDAVRKFIADGAQMLQIVDVDAARSKGENNQALIRELINETDVPIQVAGGIRTLKQINDWFEIGAARVVLGTIAITDSHLVVEAASRHPGGIIVHLATRGGYVMIDGWKTQTAFMPQDLIRNLQMTGIAGVIHKGTERLDSEFEEALALTEKLSHDVSIPVYSSGTVRTLDDIARLRYLPNINGAIISHALMTGEIQLVDALRVAAEKETNLEPESITQNVNMGIHHGIRAYLAAYNSSQASRVWNRQLRDTLTEDNPYMEVLIPQLDLVLDLDNMTPREIQAAYEAELDKSDIVIVVLEGVESEAWTGFECGYARAHGKYIYGITSDQEAKGPSQQRFEAMCDELINFTPGDDITKSHAEISHTLATRVMVKNQ